MRANGSLISIRRVIGVRSVPLVEKASSSNTSLVSATRLPSWSKPDSRA